VSTVSQCVNPHIARLRPGRPGIADWAQREVVRLGVKLEASQAMPEGQWRELTVRAIEHQLLALEAELARLQAPVITPRVLPGDAA
jgi:hypothetical protein